MKKSDFAKLTANEIRDELECGDIVLSHYRDPCIAVASIEKPDCRVAHKLNLYESRRIGARSLKRTVKTGCIEVCAGYGEGNEWVFYLSGR